MTFTCSIPRVYACCAEQLLNIRTSDLMRMPATHNSRTYRLIRVLTVTYAHDQGESKRTENVFRNTCVIVGDRSSGVSRGKVHAHEDGARLQLRTKARRATARTPSRNASGRDRAIIITRPARSLVAQCPHPVLVSLDFPPTSCTRLPHAPTLYTLAKARRPTIPVAP